MLTQEQTNAAVALRSRELTVELMNPDSPVRYHRGVRFTPVAAVIRAVCDGREYLFHKARPDPLTDVAGLFAEFDLVTPPPGFAEAPVGGNFVKIGVGALVKTEERYRFAAPYPVTLLARTETEWRDDQVRFRQRLAPVNGYGYELSATVLVAERSLVVQWELVNCGIKQFATHHYAHNSFVFDNRPVGPDYVVTFPFDFAARGLQAEQQQTGREIRFTAEIPTAVNIAVDYPPAYAGPNIVSVSQAGTGMRVDCVTSLPGERVALHAARHYVCPEQFVQIALAPGESCQWTRSYNFEAAAPRDSQPVK